MIIEINFSKKSLKVRLFKILYRFQVISRLLKNYSLLFKKKNDMLPKH